jgi:hypothetical protein
MLEMQQQQMANSSVYAPQVWTHVASDAASVVFNRKIGHLQQHLFCCCHMLEMQQQQLAYSSMFMPQVQLQMMAVLLLMHVCVGF